MRNWELTGLVATLVITLALPIYVYRENSRRQTPVEEKAVFVGSQSCSKCHKKEFEEWQTSHHARAMAVAGEETVLGDFNGATFEKDGILSRFYRKGDNYFVHTSGPGGEMAEFEISHTFGWYPLQQYLVPFPGGRLQCLPIAWDVEKKEWFHLYPDLHIDPGEWIYWTNQGQNWNSMCADCHSTELQKNYDASSDSYSTRWAEISVGCEACHGPGSQHMTWAELPEMARAKDDDGLLVKTSGTDNRQQVENCAPCHSRRSMLGDYVYQQQDLLDTAVVRLLEEGLYFADGQIRDEVYVYGSFVQSKMYANDVRCSDCHNSHSIKLHQEGNELCLQCHQAVVYDSKSHHFHKREGEKGEPILSEEGGVLFAVGTGVLCVECHMPGRYYMVNDYRPDHSIRVPRPDLSVKTGTPNACNRCHYDKTDQWSADHTLKWYGSKEKYHYGNTFAAARDRDPRAREELIGLVADPLSPVLVRATALSLLGANYFGDSVLKAYAAVLASDDALLRRTALLSLPLLSVEEYMQLVGPLLNDPVKGVRIEAGRALTRVPPDQLGERWKEPLQEVLDEFESVALYSSDFAASSMNLGALYSYHGQEDRAAEQFRKAVSIDRSFYNARINLATLYSRQGNNERAEEELRKALAVNPDLPEVHYSLGLLLSEMQQYEEAVAHLRKAATGLVYSGRAYYNLAQLLLFLRQDEEAEAAFWQCVQLEPWNVSFVQAAAQFYLARGQLDQVREMGLKMLEQDPGSGLGRQLIDYVDSMK